MKKDLTQGGVERVARTKREQKVDAQRRAKAKRRKAHKRVREQRRRMRSL